MAIVKDKIYPSNEYNSNDLVPFIRDLISMWGSEVVIEPSNWETLRETNTWIKIYINEERNFRIIVSYQSGAVGAAIGIEYRNGNNWTAGHTVYSDRYAAMNVKFEQFPETLIMNIKMQDNLVSVSATDCDKIIITNGLNSVTQERAPIAIWLGSHSSDNKCMMFAGDMTVPIDQTALNANANVNAWTTHMIPFWSLRSAFVTENLFQSLCMNISSWYFGYITMNGEPFRISGSVFVSDD